MSLAENWHVIDLKDPTHDALVKELMTFRRGEGHPSAARLNGLYYLTDILGEGIPERALEELGRYRVERGHDPQSAIGAFFYLAGWDVGLDSVDQRRYRYITEYPCDPSTALRRANRGIRELAALIRDRDEHSRPWAFVSIFQSGDAFQPFLDFNLGYESWKPPTVLIDGIEQAIDFHVHKDAEAPNRFTRRIVLPESPLNLDVAFGQPMATLRVIWPMPLWPTWNLVSWTADPRILTRLRTFRQRAVEVSLEWWRKEPPHQVEGLVSDGRIWADRQNPGRMNLPPRWRVRPHG